MPIVSSVQVIDISRTGALLGADCPLQPGDQGTLCLDINGSAFKAAIQIQRVGSARTANHRHELGASFLSMSMEHDLLLRRIRS